MLEAIKNAFKEGKDKPEHIKPPVPMTTPASEETIEERRSDGTVRVLKRAAPGCAWQCVEIRGDG